MEENTSGRGDAKLLEELGVQERQSDHLFQLIDIYDNHEFSFYL